VADLAVSDTMRRWDARQALLKRQPLVALAFHAIAIKDERAGSQMNMIAVLADLRPGKRSKHPASTSP
jgi:hypothetical protein